MQLISLTPTNGVVKKHVNGAFFLFSHQSEVKHGIDQVQKVTVLVVFCIYLCISYFAMACSFLQLIFTLQFLHNFYIKVDINR